MVRMDCFASTAAKKAHLVYHVAASLLRSPCRGICCKKPLTEPTNSTSTVNKYLSNVVEDILYGGELKDLIGGI